uniref:Uncharacterized protein n=1 Tax=Panagrolaimus sp. ES5 TaxID=591445 RepID=A0AC34G8Q2_9BILA
RAVGIKTKNHTNHQ